MSFIYSQALVEASSLGKCLDTEPSVQSSGNHTHKLSLWHDKTMEPSRLSRFGMTCRHLMEDLGAELLTSWLEASRAKTYPLPEKAQESMENAAECGNTWRGWLAKYDPDTSLWKTAQCSFLEDLTECLETFPRSGMTRGGLLWELPMLGRRTSGTGCGYLLPTPVSIDAGSGRINKSIGSSRKRPTLALMARKNLWPTPTVNGNHNRKGLSATSGDGLATAVKMWPTPQASDNRNRGTTQPLAIARRIKDGKQVMLSMCMDGPLNPNWVEWLMGWPIGHTDLKPSETVKCPNVQQQPSDFLLEVCE